LKNYQPNNCRNTKLNTTNLIPFYLKAKTSRSIILSIETKKNHMKKIFNTPHEKRPSRNRTHLNLKEYLKLKEPEPHLALGF
jgi:hypothetical protein